MSELRAKRCVPCRGGMPPLPEVRQDALAKELKEWNIVNCHHLSKTFPFRDFAQGLALVNQIGAIAEEEGHHPDIYLAWGSVRVDIWTHKIDNLTESDFILAAKIDALESA